MTKHIAIAALFALGSTAAVAGQDAHQPHAIQAEPAGTFYKFEQLGPAGLSDRGTLLNQKAATRFMESEPMAGMAERLPLMQAPAPAMTPPVGFVEPQWWLAPGTPLAAAGDAAGPAKPEGAKPHHGKPSGSATN